MQITPLINSLQNSRYFFSFFKRETVEWSAGHAPSPIVRVRACLRWPETREKIMSVMLCRLIENEILA